MKDKGLEQIVNEALGETHGFDPKGALGQFRKIAKAMRVPLQAAPRSAIARAKAIMPVHSAQGRRASLVFCSLQPQAVRSARSESFQMVFESDAVRVRLMVSPIGERWEVVGEVEGPDCQITNNRRKVEATDGRFAFKASTLKHTGLVLELPEGSVLIPSAMEAASGHAEPD